MPTNAKNSNSKEAASFFPSKLHDLLENAEKRGYGDIISWQEGGSSFKIWKPQQFVSTLLNKYFKQTKIKSFQRQLNIYGFKRVGTGTNRGGYFHTSFLTGMPHLCKTMKRSRNGATNNSSATASASSASDTAPMSSSLMNEIDITPIDIHVNNGQGFSHSVYNNAMTSAYYPHKDNETILRDASSTMANMHDPFGVLGTNFFGSTLNHQAQMRSQEASNPMILGVSGKITEELNLFANIFTGKELQADDLLEDFPSKSNHTYNNNNRNNYVQNSSSSPMASGLGDNVFPQKLHQLLNEAEAKGFNHIISWVQDGAAFKVHDSKAFLKEIMPLWFDQTKYESFRRQLNLYGFQRIRQGPSRGTYFHSFFQRSAPSLCESITRPGPSVSCNSNTSLVVDGSCQSCSIPMIQTHVAC